MLTFPLFLLSCVGLFLLGNSSAQSPSVCSKDADTSTDESPPPPPSHAARPLRDPTAPSPPSPSARSSSSSSLNAVDPVNVFKSKESTRSSSRIGAENPKLREHFGGEKESKREKRHDQGKDLFNIKNTGSYGERERRYREYLLHTGYDSGE